MVALIVGVGVAGCVTKPPPPGEFRVVKGHGMSAFAVHEECMRVSAGDRIEYVFESTEPLHFDIHFRAGGATLLPLSQDGVREGAAVYPVLESQVLCLGWEASAAGARLDYRFRIRLPEA
ncbi:MAG: hypothetical protein ABI920_16510 [Casimicrobiaceae bacterium]